MIVNHMIAIVLAVLLDRMFGDPRWLPHPVVGIGKLITFLERPLNNGAKRKQKGLLFIGLILLAVGSLVFFVCMVSYLVHPILGMAVEAILISLTIAQRGLAEAANEVKQPLEMQDLQEARKKLSYIVGRDTEHLQESEIVRGTVETVAENTSDGVTAPLFYALFGGAPLAFIYRAINTCDSMVGYKNERYADFGWASARMDDFVNLIPSRMTGLLMVTLNPSEYSKKECFQILFHDAKRHPSPNSGWGEAAVSALLGIQLGGVNTYKGIISNRATMGIAKKQLETIHIPQTVAIMRRAVIGFVLILLVMGGILLVAA